MADEPSPDSMLGGAIRHLFLSPHYDDIALSVGATVAELRDLGFAPESVVIFGDYPDPDQALSAFANQLHDGWGLNAETVIASRRAEEAAASAVLGATSSVLPFRDAIYRGHRYLSDDHLFDRPVPDEAALPDAIIAALQLGRDPKPDVRVYAPIGIGGHVDHQLTFEAGRRLANAGWDVWFYEDVPYAMKPGAPSTRFAAIGETALAPVAAVPAAAGWERKIAAVLCYPSQLETVFRQYVGIGTRREEISAALADYARKAGAGTLAERFWTANRAPRGTRC